MIYHGFFFEEIMTETLLMAIAIAFIIEGILPALFPNKWRNYVAKLAEEPVANIRTIGIVIIAIGIIMLVIVSPS